MRRPWPGTEMICSPVRTFGEAIGQQIRGGQVSDHASKALRACRMDIEKEERSMRKRRRRPYGPERT